MRSNRVTTPYSGMKKLNHFRELLREDVGTVFGPMPGVRIGVGSETVLVSLDVDSGEISLVSLVNGRSRQVATVSTARIQYREGIVALNLSGSSS